uniref:Fibronectin type-III domain-containing protein n=1 Tax=Magallana gigas TaxID=29159 RepID=A0A8W8NKW3_MAGGI
MHLLSHWFVVGFLLSLIPIFQAFFFQPSGELTPKYPLILINQTLELNCTVFPDSGLNTSLLKFELPLNIEASSDMLTVVGDRTLLLKKTISTIEDKGSYNCWRVNEIGSPVSMVGSVNLIVEYEDVRNVTDFQCILDNTSNPQEFRCNWNLGKYLNPAYLDVNIILSVDNGQNSVNCPQKKIREQCVWTEHDEPNINSMSKIVILNVTNLVFKTSKIFRKEFWTQNISKPAPPNFINASSSSLEKCGCASITWATIPGGVNTTSSVTLMSQWNTVPLTHIVNTDSSLEVCNLVPATNYIVEIKIKPVGGMYYSNTADMDFETCHTAPSSAPHMDASGYFSRDCANGDRHVVVYWEKINQKFHNGPLSEYKVFVDDAEVGARGPQEVSSSLSIPCEGQHNVSVRGCNQQGCSPKDSILIPSYRETVDLQRVVMEQSESEVHLTWFGTENEALTAVDIAWCKMRPTGFKCKDEIHILRSENANSIVLHQETIGQDIDEYLFGVAAINNRNISSGVTWQDECRYVKNAVPPAVQHVSLLPSLPKNSLTISWAPIKCDSGTNNAYINQYQIIYCQQPTADTCDTSDVSMVNVSAWGITQYTLRDLRPDVEYGVMVRALSLTKEGPQSKTITGRPNNNDLSEEQVVGIVIGSIFVLIFVAAGCFCVVRQVRKALHLNEKFEIETPSVVPYRDTPSGVFPRYHSLALPSDRSSRLPLITANGTARHSSSDDSSYSEVIAIEQEGEKHCVVNSTSKSNGGTLALDDIPRQISKDSGHGSMSPTSVNQPTTPDKTVQEKELMSNAEFIPHGYAKATAINTRCFHENGSFDTGEENSPTDLKESSCQCNDLSGSGNCLLPNNTSLQSSETSKEIAAQLRLSINSVQTKNNTQHCSHEPPSGADQFKETELFAVEHYVNPSQPSLDDQTMNAQVLRNQFNKQSMIENNVSSVPKTRETSSCLKQPINDINCPDYIRNDSAIPDYLPNKSGDKIEMGDVPKEAKAFQNSVSDCVLNRPVDQIDQSHVFNDYEDKLVMGYVPNGTVGKCGPVEQLIKDIDSDRTANQPYSNHVPNKEMGEIKMNNIKCPIGKIDQSCSHQVPNDSVDSFNVNSVLNKPMDLSNVRYVKNDTAKTDLESEKLENFSNCTKDVNTTSLFDSDVDRKCNPEFETESDTSSGSFANRSCIHNSGYVTADMINSAGFVSTEAVEQESSGDEGEREEVIFNSGI